MAWRIFRRVLNSGKDAASLITGNVGMKNVAKKDTTGLSAAAISQSRFLESFFEQERKLSNRIFADTKEAERKIRDYNRDMAKQAVLLHMEGVKEDLRRYQVLIGSMFHVLGQNTWVFDRFKDALGRRQLQALFIQSEKKRLVDSILSTEKILFELRKSGTLSDNQFMKAIQNQVIERTNEQDDAIVALHNNGAAIAQFEKELAALRGMLSTTMATQKETVIFNLLRDTTTNFAKLYRNLSIVAKFAVKPQFNQKVVTQITGEFGKAVTDFYDIWDCISQLVTMQVKIEEKILYMTGGRPQLKSQIMANTQKYMKIIHHYLFEAKAA